MKNLFFLITSIIFLLSCSQEPVNLANLDNINGKTVVKGENDSYSGQVVTYYDNGKIKLEEFIQEGEKHGKHINYYKSGKKKTEGEYKEGKRKGVWKWWSEKGEVDFKVNYSSTVSLRF